MSDAIVLDVADATPVRLDVGDVDLIAREEIAALAGRVTTVEGDVTALDGRMDTAEGEISTLGTTVDGIDARVEAIEADYVTAEDVMGALGGEAPSLSAGSATGITGDVETASWMARQTHADGAALIESVKGNTLRWNQLINAGQVSITINGLTVATVTNGKYTAVGTAEGTGTNAWFAGAWTSTKPLFTLKVGHKYIAKDCAAFSSGADGRHGWTCDIHVPYYFSPQSDIVVTCVRFPNVVAGTTYNTTVYPQLFDLTVMFGAGNEPATVAEFEALFPLPYYPYDAGSLLPVRMEGIETVGFNQWDEVWESGTISSTTGQNGIDSSVWRTKNYIPVLSGATYYATGTPVSGTDGNMRGRFYAADKTYISDLDANNQSLRLNRAFTVPSGARFLRFAPQNSQIVDKRICINLSDPSRNGEYEPYWRSERAIAASTYFPDGMRSAGSVRDELTETQAITRVGSVDLGTLTWTYNNTKFSTTGIASLVAHPTSGLYAGNLTCALYENTSAAATDTTDKAVSVSAVGNISVHDSAYTDATAFKTAMSGVMLHYALATPTTTPIDPPLPMSYRVSAGGTERVMVAEGTTSAPPVFATRYPLDPADLAASIAPVDGPTATTNHQVGDLLMLGFTLCKATQVIVTGETIAIGTNVTKTTVATELAALSE